MEGHGIVENLAFGFDFLPHVLQLQVRLDVENRVDVLQEGCPIEVRVEDYLVR